jgi:hypothetical protein
LAKQKASLDDQTGLMGKIEKSESSLWQQVDRAGLLDRVVDLTVQLGGNSGDAAWQDLTRFGGELGEKLRIRGDDLIRRDVVTTARHATVRLTEVDTALDGFRLGHEEKGLAKFAVKGPAFEEVIEFHFLEAAGGAEALFVTCGDVT